MTTTKRWTVEILIDEETAGVTHAAARLDTSEDAHVHGQGTWPAPTGTRSPLPADDLAVAAALSEIAAKLSGRAVAETEESTGLIANG
ncbi:MAG TPA: dsRBD fold-containing protein [Kineosporiaceae bacterium]|nr:dsRBD fold-containing protein [Kineosporiaceae bacterium]